MSRALLQRTSARRALLPCARRLSTAVEPEATTSAVDDIVAATERRVLTLFERYGASDYIGEPCSITEHSVQAANAAAKAGESETAILACLLHDIGHLAGLEAGHPPGMDGCGTPEHERIGAELLGALGLPEDVSYLTHHHVSAKRYLCATQPDYYSKLTVASKTTLEHQGGAMTAEEVRMADADSRWPMVLRMRGYDEAGKDPDAVFTSPHQFLPMLRAAIRESASRQLGVPEAAGASQYPLSPHAALYVLSEEQLRYWDEYGWLVVKGGLHARFDADALSAMADDALALPRAPSDFWLDRDERSNRQQMRIHCVENICKHHTRWGEVALGAVGGVVSQALREEACLLNDRIHFIHGHPLLPTARGHLHHAPEQAASQAPFHPGATAVATDTHVTRRISVRVAIDGRDASGLASGNDDNDDDVLKPEAGPEAEASIAPWVAVSAEPGDIMLLDSYLPYRLCADTSESPRRYAYLTYKRACEGRGVHAADDAKKVSH